jgi:predicted small secreted protein
MSCKILLLGAAALGLTACNTMNKNIGQEDPFLGEAVKYNAAIQTIHPDPVYPPGGAQPGDHGEKASEAVKRYRTDKVKQIETVRDSSSATGTSGTPR